jgi:hypothetical protein
LLFEFKKEYEKSIKVLDDIMVNNPYHIESGIKYAEIMIDEFNQTEKAFSALSHAMKVESTNPKI